jgi:predicted O-linked N-acetylglucosamine transferase (SPINDLY family)
VRAVRDQDLDLLVFVGDVTATAHQVALLALHRLARRHIALTDCPATTGMRHMDFFLSGELLETAQSPGHYSERLALLPGAGGCGLDDMAVGGSATTGINRPMVGIGPADVVFACGASCHKFTPELEESFARILQSVPNSRLLIYPFNPTRLRSYLIPRFLRTLQQRFSRYGLAADRIRIFAPTFNPADIRQWLKLADVYLDAFPFSGFHSVIDALKTALPVVSLEGSCARGRRGAALLRELDVPELIAQSEDEYLRLAVKLGTDAAFRKAEAQRIAAAMRRGPRFMNPASHAADVQRAFCQMAAELFNKR